MVNFLPTIRLAQSILKRKFPSIDEPLQIIISPSKRAFEKHKPRGLFSEFCGTFKISTCDFIKRNSEQEEFHYVKKVICIYSFYFYLINC